MIFEALLLILLEADPENLYAVTAQASACAFLIAVTTTAAPWDAFGVDIPEYFFERMDVI